MTSHTPTPWVVRGSRIYDANDEETAVATRASPRNRAHTKETANRIVACVNACAGINPEAVKDLRSVLTNALKWWGVGRPAPTWVVDAQAALAKAKLP